MASNALQASLHETRCARGLETKACATQITVYLQLINYWLLKFEHFNKFNCERRGELAYEYTGIVADVSYQLNLSL